MHVLLEKEPLDLPASVKWEEFTDTFRQTFLDNVWLSQRNERWRLVDTVDEKHGVFKIREELTNPDKILEWYNNRSDFPIKSLFDLPVKAKFRFRRATVEEENIHYDQIIDSIGHRQNPFICSFVVGPNHAFWKFIQDKQVICQSKVSYYIEHLRDSHVEQRIKRDVSEDQFMELKHIKNELNLSGGWQTIYELIYDKNPQEYVAALKEFQ